MSAGGRIIDFDDDNLLVSMGEYLNFYLAQDIESDNGKIIKVNKNNGYHSLISIGHRNPQGLYYDKENNYILETEHGPKGGDEINLINILNIDNKKILNYGWPISSYGEHYDNKIDQSLYSKYPLYKSHSKYGFIEPIKYFSPSIGISEIVKIKNKKYVVSSLKYQSLYFFELDNKNNLINLEKVEVYERIRDMKFHNSKLYLFMEDTASIGIIDLS
jgi:glucose/arabinose dehydrogenase